ncbi:hypothetical protein LRS13_21975 [Svornostia abyssi]|uniref:Uncharacterized protein n=1 Tax=Svornostia abyssi TaxID=2898438 RepID=A0ABY5PF90_9ACTN|nr:hypothetical protein LRS13_21975 [Parviterribacteraceae bacterium J379]
MRVPVVIAALALSLLVPTQAGATTTFGTDLNRAPDDGMVDCTTLPPWGVPTFADSCTWYSTISATENHIVPEGIGVITRARVRVGRVTGPMQFAIGRAQVDRNKEPGQGTLCCVWRPAGPEFTPAPSAVTEVVLNEPVQRVRDFASNQDLFDNLGLSVLQAGVPIPAAPAVSPIGSTSTAGACWPAVQRGNSYCMPGGPGNYAVLFNADWEYTPTGAGGDVSVNLAREFAWVRRNEARVRLLCQLARECAGLLRLQNRKAPGAAAAAAASATVTYGSARFKIAAGATKTVEVKLGASGRKLMRRRRTVTVWANSTTGSGASTRVVSAKLKLKR